MVFKSRTETDHIKIKILIKPIEEYSVFPWLTLRGSRQHEVLTTSFFLAMANVDRQPASALLPGLPTNGVWPLASVLVL